MKSKQYGLQNQKETSTEQARSQCLSCNHEGEPDFPNTVFVIFFSPSTRTPIQTTSFLILRS